MIDHEVWESQFLLTAKKMKKNPLSKRDRIFRHVSNSTPENQSIWKILCGVSFGSIFFLYSELFFVDCVVENSFALLAAYFFVFPPIFFSFLFYFCLLWSAVHAAVAVMLLLLA